MTLSRPRCISIHSDMFRYFLSYFVDTLLKLLRFFFFITLPQIFNKWIVMSKFLFLNIFNSKDLPTWSSRKKKARKTGPFLWQISWDSTDVGSQSAKVFLYIFWLFLPNWILCTFALGKKPKMSLLSLFWLNMHFSEKLPSKLWA